MSVLHINRGLPGAGKSTFAREWVDESPANRIRVNRDELRAMIHTSYSGRATEDGVTVLAHAAVRNALRRGLDVIVDDTNLNAGIVKTWLKIADQTGSTVEFHDFHIPVDEAVRRDSERAEPIGEAVIRKMHGRYIASHKGEFVPRPAIAPRPTFAPYVPDPALMRAVIVDIDGTLALNLGGRSPYDYSRVHEDSANLPVKALAETLCSLGHELIIMSGRDEACAGETIDWLGKELGWEHGTDYTGPFMRATDDKRDDAIVKLELFDEYVRDHYNVRYVLDDRNRVVAAWRSIGLTVLQVADGDF